MRILIGATVLILVNWFAIVPLFSKVDEEDIGENIKHLKKHQWFQNILRNKEYQHLIIHDNDVRKIIGKFNSDRLNKDFFKNKYQKKIQSILLKKSNGLI